MDDLSPRQREILDFMVSAIDQKGIAPTYREIGAALQISSTNGVSDHVKALIRKGYLQRGAIAGSPRSLVPTTRATGFADDTATVGVPLLGRVAAGQPLLAEENYERTIRVDAALLPPGGNVFALKVTGQSMIDDGIHDGDVLFVRQQKAARNGEIAVVLVDGEATVKRLYREGKRLRLQPANATMQPIYVDEASGDCEVVGIAVGIFRQLG